MCTAVHNAPVLPVHNMSPVVPVGTSASVAGDSRVQITSCALTAHLGNSFHDDDDDQDGTFPSMVMMMMMMMTSCGFTSAHGFHFSSIHPNS